MDRRKKLKQFNLLELAESFDDDEETSELSSEALREVDSGNEVVETVEVSEETEPAPLELASYGYCACWRAIVIPGLGASLCPSCGWRTTLN